MEDRGLWKRTLDELALELPELTINSFFKKARFFLYNDQVKIICPNNGVSFVLKNKYRLQLEKVLEKQIGQKIHNLIITTDGLTKASGHNLGPLFNQAEETLEEKILRIGLSPRLSFENFAVSVSNQLAQAAALAVSENPGLVYNPLFVWGGVGVGKTHLLHAIGRKIIETTNKSVYYCSTEDFTNLLIDAIKNKNTNSFRRKMRGVDVLLMDDIQFVSEREFIQEELFHTFNKLQSLNKQIVFTSDKPPKAIKKIEERLVSRFLSGLVVDVQPPDFELKTAILLIKAREKKLELSVSQAKTISANIEELRELEGFLLKLTALKNSGVVINEETIGKLLVGGGTNPSIQRQKNPKEIIRIVAQSQNTRLKDIYEESRRKDLVFCRHLIMYFLKTLTNLTYADIANLLGKKDHTTVIHGVQKIISLSATDPETRSIIEKIKLYFS